MSIVSISIASMPDEVMYQILSNLDRSSLGRCTRISRDWRRLASDDSLWRQLFPRLKIPNTEVKAYLYEFLSRAVWSNEELLERVQKFADKIHGNRLGMLECKFPYNPDYWINVGYDYTSDFTYSGIQTNIRKIFGSQSEEVYFMKPLPSSPPRICHASIVGKAFFVVTGASLHLPEFESEDLITETTRKVSGRLEFLESRSFLRNPIFLAVGTIALSAFCLGLYFTKRK